MRDGAAPAPGGFLSAQSVSGLLERQAARYGDNALFVFPEAVRAAWELPAAEITYAAMQARVARLSAAYAEAGFGAGDRVALLAGNRPAHFRHWLALNALSVSVVPVNPQASAEELDYLLSHSDSRLLVRLAEHAALADPVAARLGVPVIGPDDMPPSLGGARDVARPGLSTECALIYTSGTTGKPKGCLLSNRFFLNWADWYAGQGGHIALRDGVERLLTPLPTFHVNAMGHSFMGMLSCGGAQIIVDRFHPRSWWQDAVETGATCFHYLGVMPAILMELPVSEAERAHRMRFGLGGGVHPDHHAKFEERFGVPLLEGWAMTETGGAGTLCAVTEPRHVGQRCIGRPDRPGPAVEMRVIGEDGQEMPRGEPGELVLRAPGDDPRLGFFSGYLKDPEATETVWQDGWLHTGDVMRMDGDGALFFVERKKNIIRRSGENIAASEVEAVISEVPGISAVAVIASPDPLREEEVLAAIVPAAGQETEALVEAVFAACAERLTYFKVPGLIVPVESLPTTSTQKVQKAGLRALANDPLSAPGCVDMRERKNALRKAKSA